MHSSNDEILSIADRDNHLPSPFCMPLHKAWDGEESDQLFSLPCGVMKDASIRKEEKFCLRRGRNNETSMICFLLPLYLFFVSRSSEGKVNGNECQTPGACPKSIVQVAVTFLNFTWQPIGHCNNGAPAWQSERRRILHPALKEHWVPLANVTTIGKRNV